MLMYNNRGETLSNILSKRRDRLIGHFLRHEWLVKLAEEISV